MLIATRMLRLSRPAGDAEIAVRVFAPEQRSDHWVCRIEVGWPDGALTMEAGGVDSIQALTLALQLIGSQIYASDHHASGKLVWQELGKGYGFPVTHNLRDMLVGDDRRFL